jgi:hypothetical protein
MNEWSKIDKDEPPWRLRHGTVRAHTFYSENPASGRVMNRMHQQANRPSTGPNIMTDRSIIQGEFRSHRANHSHLDAHRFATPRRPPRWEHTRCSSSHGQAMLTTFLLARQAGRISRRHPSAYILLPDRFAILAPCRRWCQPTSIGSDLPWDMCGFAGQRGRPVWHCVR